MKEHEREQSQAEEIANSISHAIGLVAALFGAPFLIIRSARYGDTAFIVGSILFSASIIILYLSSTIYHWLPVGRIKRIFRVTEHSTIFILIAGTYTPFTLGVLRGLWGWTLFGIIWSIALVGIALKVFDKFSHSIISNGLYLLMGWLVVIAAGPLFENMEPNGLFWLVAGGLFYTAGIAFFVTDSRLKYGHLIWHLFVLAGTACHYFAVLWYGY